MKVESVERRECACCSACRRRERLTGAWEALLNWRRHFAILAVSARNVPTEVATAFPSTVVVPPKPRSAMTSMHFVCNTEADCMH